MNLAPLIDDAFSQFETFIQENASLAYSRGMPILYFGNLTAYAKAPKRIVTAALNPADGEFNIEGDYSLKHRFPKSVYVMASHGVFSRGRSSFIAFVIIILYRKNRMTQEAMTKPK